MFNDTKRIIAIIWNGLRTVVAVGLLAYCALGEDGILWKIGIAFLSITGLCGSIPKLIKQLKRKRQSEN